MIGNQRKVSDVVFVRNVCRLKGRKQEEYILKYGNDKDKAYAATIDYAGKDFLSDLNRLFGKYMDRNTPLADLVSDADLFLDCVKKEVKKE